MNIREFAGWQGYFTIEVNGEKITIKNRITNAGLNLLRDLLFGDNLNSQINYFAVGDSDAPLNDNMTKLGNEIFRTAVIDRKKTGTGTLETISFLLDTDGNLNIREIGVFAGGTSAKDSGVLVSRVLWSRDKTNLETIKLIRTDIIGRG